MERSQRQFLELLRSGLWGSEPSAELFCAPVNWSEILTLAQRQTVLGLLYDSILRLPSEQQPSVSVMRRLHFKISRNRQQVELHTALISELSKILKGKDPILMKGLDSASLYADPTLRTCGDVDIYVDSGEFDSSHELLKEWSDEVLSIEKFDKHNIYQKQGVVVELHNSIASALKQFWRQREFERWTARSIEKDRLRSFELDGGSSISLLPRDYNLFYLFYHAWSHLEEDGVGLRHICDWALALKHYHDDVDWQDMRCRLERFGLLRAWQLFEYIAVETLDLESSFCPMWDKSGLGAQEDMVRKIVEGGNFGFYTLARKDYVSTFGKVVHNTSLLWSMDRVYSLSYFVGRVGMTLHRARFKLLNR